jgi:hypothetical protein
MKVIAVLFSISLVSSAAATSWHRTAQIDEAAAAFLSADGDATVVADPRLRLPQCAVPLQAGWLTQKRHTVVVSCSAPVPWRVSLPVQRQRPVETGSGLPSRPPLFDVRAGDRVMLRYEAPDFQLDMQVIALSTARRGEPVRVRTGAGQPVLMAEVTGEGRTRFLAKDE